MNCKFDNRCFIQGMEITTGWSTSIYCSRSDSYVRWILFLQVLYLWWRLINKASLVIIKNQPADIDEFQLTLFKGYRNYTSNFFFVGLLHSNIWLVDTIIGLLHQVNIRMWDDFHDDYYTAPGRIICWLDLTEILDKIKC